MKATPAFAADIQEIFNRTGCAQSSCHGSAQQGSLDLRTGTSYGQLVNVMGSQEAIIRVIPNDANGSYLVIKLEGRQTVGTSMPQGGAALDTIDMNNIKNWINTGAPNN